MHSHDLDLIAAFADGSLQDSAEAQGLIEACARCRAEYDAQLSTLAALDALPPVNPMTDIERAALHRDLWTELRNPPVSAKAANPWWYRWSYAAAGLFVVVGLAGVLSQLDQDDSAQPETLLAADTTAGGDSSTRDEEAEQFAPQAEGGATATTTAADGGPQESPTTTAAATATTLTGLAADEDFEEVAAAARTSALPESTTPTTVAQQAEQCLDDEALGGHEVLATIELDRTYLILVPAGVQLTQNTPITFVDAATCEVVRVVE
jgi:hypothetical protein